MTTAMATDPIRIKDPVKTYTTIIQSLITGSVAGAVEVGVNHPLWTVKIRLQCGDPFTLNPRLLYRGILPNAASMIPVTGIQVGLDRFFQHIFFKETNELSNAQCIASAFVAGVGSAPASCATEMVLTHQKNTGWGFYAAGKYLITNHGYRNLFTGLPATMTREGVFTPFFLAVTPLLKGALQPHLSNDYAASLVAGMGSGIAATILSQAADTIKTIQQGAEQPGDVGLRAVVRELYKKQGFYGFFKGGIPRGARVVSAITVMGLVTEKMEALFRQPSVAGTGLKSNAPSR